MKPDGGRLATRPPTKWAAHLYRLSRRGNRRLNHAIHMAAVTQIRHKHSPGRAYYERKVRHEAPHDRAEVKDLRRWPVAAG